ncbi:MAG TPA: hypothetical protein VK638_44295, partial [Edaphobacter sp.]|nr:hypothetical protein [Edaphobacter sp.]
MGISNVAAAMSRSARTTLTALLVAGALCARSNSSFAQSTPQRPKMLGLAHIALFAHDMDQSRKFYS